jgi:hypothetical protein
MNSNKIAIESLSMDLLRVALGYHRGSQKMAERFLEEVQERIDDIQKSKLKPYFARILKNLPSDLSDTDKERVAENALMYSVICKNYAKNFA